ncbi:hypothetical protein PVE_R1G3255 [Pseudomonas veronii 1YdBTEX2]|jgi:hypothetical protein|uniref:Uncharacterized protein n=1 Tax=Pseudomonas veronii 1YdBTEX2 TaxID=1295141 RepID=A0A1D3JYK0_PSEVE|nr:hypothetical protein PVE_R1G3255 [Pseudomonas veronii 1YdBTEX2]
MITLRVISEAAYGSVKISNKDIDSSNAQKFARFGLVIQYTEAH